MIRKIGQSGRSSDFDRSLNGILVLVLAAAVIPVEVYGTPLAPDTGIDLFGTSAVAPPGLDGTVLETISLPFKVVVGPVSAPAEISGTIHEHVQRSTSTGLLDFYFQITNSAISGGR